MAEWNHIKTYVLKATKRETGYYALYYEQDSFEVTRAVGGTS